MTMYRNALCWAAAWDMTRDAELAARDYSISSQLSGKPAAANLQAV